MKFTLAKIISGGQTGADWAALDFAIKVGIPHGGWCPRGRITENGTIDPRFNLQETPGSDYAQRTAWNVRDSDGTVIFSTKPKLQGGSQHTWEVAKASKKPCLHLIQSHSDPQPSAALLEFLNTHHIQVLNVAGPRKSEDPEVGTFVRQVLEATLKA